MNIELKNFLDAVIEKYKNPTTDYFINRCIVLYKFCQNRNDDLFYAIISYANINNYKREKVRPSEIFESDCKSGSILKKVFVKKERSSILNALIVFENNNMHFNDDEYIKLIFCANRKIKINDAIVESLNMVRSVNKRATKEKICKYTIVYMKDIYTADSMEQSKIIEFPDPEFDKMLSELNQLLSDSKAAMQRMEELYV